MRATDLRVSLARQTPGFPLISLRLCATLTWAKRQNEAPRIQGNPGVCLANETLRSVALIFWLSEPVIEPFFMFFKKVGNCKKRLTSRIIQKLYIFEAYDFSFISLNGRFS